jgi:hypothetical protein
MTINSPDSLPDDEPEGAAAKENAGKSDGGVPAGNDGVGLGASEEANTFEPEEDPEATEEG